MPPGAPASSQLHEVRSVLKAFWAFSDYP